MKSVYEYIPKEIKEKGFTKDIITEIYSQLYIKKYMEQQIDKAEYEQQLMTLEGLVTVKPGMYIVLGSRGEKYVIDEEILNLTYDKVLNKNNVYTKKRYPVIAEEKKEAFTVPSDIAVDGALRGKAGDYLIQSMISSKNIYPIDRQIFAETYVPYVDYLREKYGVVDEKFEEEEIDEVKKPKNIFQRIVEWFKKLFKKDAIDE